MVEGGEVETFVDSIVGLIEGEEVVSGSIVALGKSVGELEGKTVGNGVGPGVEIVG